MNDGSTGSMTESLAQSGESLLRSGLKLSHMRMIVALQDTSQISAAAHILNISQPAASRMIGEMEDILSRRSATACRAASN